MNKKRYYISHLENIELLTSVPAGYVEYALDLGCGKGADACYLESLGFRVVAVDEEQHYLKAAIADIRHFTIEKEKYAVIICNNVLPFISDKKDVEQIISRIIGGLRKTGVAFFTVYGPHSGFKDDPGMSFYEHEEILSILKGFPIEVMDKTTTEGYTKNGKGEIIYQHSHRFILRKIAY